MINWFILILAFGYQDGAHTGTGGTSVPFPYTSLEECKIAGEKAKADLNANYSCLPINYSPLSEHRTRSPFSRERNND